MYGLQGFLGCRDYGVRLLEIRDTVSWALNSQIHSILRSGLGSPCLYKIQLRQCSFTVDGFLLQRQQKQNVGHLPSALVLLLVCRRSAPVSGFRFFSRRIKERSVCWRWLVNPKSQILYPSDSVEMHSVIPEKAARS